uniref:PRC-barrel domain-containing protein n=1 Tax=Desertibaculum subflavum TaxID=2268458 RepID=UPI0013C4D237
MRTPLLVAATSCLALTIGTASFAADTKPGTTAPKAAATQQMPSQVEADKLIGRDIQNTQNETIGEIESVLLGSGGKAETVVVGVGGFLGMGEKNVALKWSDLNVSQNGEKVTVAMTKEQLKSLPEFTYRDEKDRGRVVPYDVSRNDASPRTAPLATPPGRTAADTAPGARTGTDTTTPGRTAADTA